MEVPHFYEQTSLQTLAEMSTKDEMIVQVPNPEEPKTKEEDREVVSFSGPVDSVYLKAKDYVELDVGTGAAVAISSSGWEDVVVVCFSRHPPGPCHLTYKTLPLPASGLPKHA